MSLEQVKAAVAEARGESWSALSARWGDPGSAMAQWLARRHTGATLREIGEAMGGRDYAAVAMALRRLDQRLEKDRKLRRELRAVERKLNVKMSPQ